MLTSSCLIEERILEWLPFTFSRRSSWPRDRTHISCVSCIAGRFFTHWAIRNLMVYGRCFNADDKYCGCRANVKWVMFILALLCFFMSNRFLFLFLFFLYWCRIDITLLVSSVQCNSLTFVYLAKCSPQ